MENIQNYLFKYETPKSKATSERASVVEEFVKEINAERLGTKWKQVTGQRIAVSLHLLSLQDLYTFLSECRDYKKRNGSFGKRFFGGFKPQAFTKS